MMNTEVFNAKTQKENGADADACAQNTRGGSEAGKTLQRKHNPALTGLARSMRRNMTRQERRLWYDHLQKHPAKFYKQKVLGKYIADFYCAKANLVIELDGSQHYGPKGLLKDRIRSEYLEDYGITVLRFSNYDLDTNFEGVCRYINSTVEALLEETAQ